ncbi:TetR/AcrR family transcriptional regulator [uncultured Algimonas sp.]|uniref:TetR/AcrR family transcriptional regulator n=1 Tax=uncultured Algimonas sp. TaxID=1547920 RepID=UPI0026119F73|nr:TetR/AcrR family transcriptional regulator [uncultured Algimonas sp.]
MAASSLRPMAKAAGTSDRMLVYHYGSKAGVMEAALREIADRNMAMLDSALPAEPVAAERLMAVIGMAMENGLFDSSVAVFLELAANALRGDALSREIGQAIAEHYRDWVAARLNDPARTTELLIALEGWSVLNAVGLDVPFPTG